MRRSTYVAELLRLYLEAPDTPRRVSRHDRRVAAELYLEGVSLDRLAHAVRLATLRRQRHRHPRPPERIRSLAYYRTALQRLNADESHPDYVAYVYDAHQRLRLTSEPRPRSQNPALSDRR